VLVFLKYFFCLWFKLKRHKIMSISSCGNSVLGILVYVAVACITAVAILKSIFDSVLEN